MRQAFVFLLMFMGACFSSFSADIKKASVISDGDRGLALEWVKEVEGSVSSMTSDENGDLYLLGGLTGNFDSDYVNNKKIYYVAKYTPRGEMVWIKEMYREDYGQLYSLLRLVYQSGRLYFETGITNHDVYYDNQLVWTKSAIKPDVFFEVDAQDGSFIRCDGFYNFCNYVDFIYIGESKKGDICKTLLYHPFSLFKTWHQMQKICKIEPAYLFQL